MSVGIISGICFTGFGVLRILQHSQVFGIYNFIQPGVRKIRLEFKEGPIKRILFRYLPKLKVTEFRKNEDYSFYVLGSNFAFMGKSNREKYIKK